VNWLINKGISVSCCFTISRSAGVQAHPLQILTRVLCSLLLICVVLGSGIAAGQDSSENRLNPGHNGAWINSETPGQGFLLDVMPETNIAFLAWFTYDTTLPGPEETARVGYPGHRWLTAQGPIVGNKANLDVYLSSDGLFNDPRPVGLAPEGSITLSFDDCASGTVDYQLTSAGLSGSIPIERIVHDNVALCGSIGTAQQEAGRSALMNAKQAHVNTSPVPPAKNASSVKNCRMNPGHNGAWINSETPGQGFLLDVMPETNIAFLSWFTYDTALPGPEETARVGDPGHRWLTAQGPIVGNKANLDVYLSSDGLFNDPRPVGLVPEGSITLSFEDCASGTVDYQLTSAGLSGSIPIERIVHDNVAMCESLCGEVVNESSGKQSTVIGLEGGAVDVVDKRGNILRLAIPEGVLVGATDHRIEVFPLAAQTALPTGQFAFAGLNWTSDLGTVIAPATLKVFTEEVENFTDIAAFSYGKQGEAFYFLPALIATDEGVVIEVPSVQLGVTGLAYVTAAEMEQWQPPDYPSSARYLQQMAIAAKKEVESARARHTETFGVLRMMSAESGKGSKLLQDELDLGETFLPFMKDWFDNEVNPVLSVATKGCDVAVDFTSVMLEWLTAVQQYGLENHSQLQGRIGALESAMNEFAIAAGQDISTLDQQCDLEPDPCKQMEIMRTGAACAESAQLVGRDDDIPDLACSEAPALLSVSPKNSSRCPGASIQFYANVRNLRGDALPVDQYDLLWLSEAPHLLSIGAESGLAETLAPGNAWVTASSEVCGGTMEGSAHVEINGVPDIAGSYSLVGSETWRGCLDPEDDGIYGIHGTASISITSEDEKAGSAQFSGSSNGSGFGASFGGTVSCGGAFSGSGGYSEEDGTTGSTTFNGTFTPNALRLDFSAQDQSGDTCSSSGWVRGTK